MSLENPIFERFIDSKAKHGRMFFQSTMKYNEFFKVQCRTTKYNEVQLVFKSTMKYNEVQNLSD